MEGVCMASVLPELRSPRSGRTYRLLRPLATGKPDVQIYEALAIPTKRGVEGGRISPRRVVIKSLRLSRSSRTCAGQELSALMALSVRSHTPTHVVPLLEALQTQRCLHLVLPLVEGGDLFDRVAEAAAEGHDGLSQHEARAYFRDVVTGLLELKACGIAHGDVSCENIMLSSDGHAHVIDLGSSSMASFPSSCYKGKPNYLPPEARGGCVMETAAHFASDVWSLGVCLYVMLCGRPLYHGPTDPAFALLASDHAADLLQHYESFGLCLEPQAFALISSMLRAKPGSRPTLEEVWSHAWVQDHASRDVVEP